MGNIPWIERVLEVEQPDNRPRVRTFGPDFTSDRAQGVTTKHGIGLILGGSFADNLYVLLHELVHWRHRGDEDYSRHRQPFFRELRPLVARWGFGQEYAVKREEIVPSWFAEDPWPEVTEMSVSSVLE